MSRSWLHHRIGNHGMFLTDIARKRRMVEFDNFIVFARKSEGRARVLNHRYSNLEIVHALMQHSAALYQTDATPFPEGVQNPGAYGNFPLFLQYARDYRLLRLEEAVFINGKRVLAGGNSDVQALPGMVL